MIDPAAVMEARGLVSPSAVVNFADKRVLHQSVVSLEVRAEDLIRRYGTTSEKKNWLEESARNSLELERGLFDLTGGDPIDADEINRLFEPVKLNGPAGKP